MYLGPKRNEVNIFSGSSLTIILESMGPGGFLLKYWFHQIKK